MASERDQAQNEVFGKAYGDPAEIGREEAVQAGLELLGDRVDALGGEDQAAEAYQDLCLGLNLLQIKQVNTLIGLILGQED